MTPTGLPSSGGTPPSAAPGEPGNPEAPQQPGEGPNVNEPNVVPPPAPPPDTDAPPAPSPERLQVQPPPGELR